MVKSILFIQENSSFLINAIISSLKKNAFLCDAITFDIDEISKLAEYYECIFLNVEKDTAFRHSKELIFLKDQGSFNDKKFMIMGTPNDISECIELMTDNSLVAAFERPINTRDVVDRVLEVFETVMDSRGKKTILVVDDSGTFLHAIKSWLDKDYKVIMVSSATNAISYLATNNPDLILLDYEMPVCSGPDLLEMIRADKSNADIPVMFLTGKGDRESVEKVLSLHPQGYMLKSISRPDMLKTLSDFFAKQEAAETREEDATLDSFSILNDYLKNN